MKTFLVTGSVKCGHKIFNLKKRIVADTAEGAIAVFKENFPPRKNDSHQASLKNSKMGVDKTPNP